MAILKSLGYEQITGLSTVKTLTVPAGATLALLQAEAQNIRWRNDGTDPTAGIGMILVAGQAPTEYKGDLSLLEFIEATASAKLNVAYFA